MKLMNLLHNRLGWLAPISVAIAVYYVGINNFFTSDDFMWLDRAHTFTQNRLQIFRPDVAYFDPLVHLMFVADFLVTGLDHRWCHGVDLAIHAANSLLVYRFSQLLVIDKRAALYGSILFAGSCIIADAVLWSSSRVDLLSTFFFLGALIQFLHHLHDNKPKNLLFSLLLFLLALGAKGTPLILPLILSWLIIQEKKPLPYFTRLIPFGVVGTLYIVLLKLSEHMAALPVNIMHFNIHNIILAICTLFIPEELLTHLNPLLTAILLFIAISVFGLSTAPKLTITLRRTGYFLLLAATMPLLVIGDLTLVTNNSSFIDLMGSPSHRIYLASVGAALLGGGLVRTIETLLENSFPRYALGAVILIISGIVAADAFLVRKRDRLWEMEGNKTRTVVEFLDAYQGRGTEGSQIGLIGFPASRMYMEPMIKRHLGVNDAVFNHYVDIGMTVDPAILQKAENSFLFVFGKDGYIYDRSGMYRKQLLLSRRALSNISNPVYISEAQTVTFELISEINQILGL